MKCLKSCHFEHLVWWIQVAHETNFLILRPFLELFCFEMPTSKETQAGQLHWHGASVSIICMHWFGTVCKCPCFAVSMLLWRLRWLLLPSNTPWSTARMRRMWVFRHPWYITISFNETKPSIYMSLLMWDFDLGCNMLYHVEGVWNNIAPNMEFDESSYILCLWLCNHLPLSGCIVHLAQAWALDEGNIIRGLANYVITRTSRTTVGRLIDRHSFSSKLFNFVNIVLCSNLALANMSLVAVPKTSQEWEVPVAEEHCETEVRGLRTSDMHALHWQQILFQEHGIVSRKTSRTFRKKEDLLGSKVDNVETQVLPENEGKGPWTTTHYFTCFHGLIMF